MTEPTATRDPSAFVRDLASTHDLARDIAHDLTRALALGGVLAQVLARDRALDRALALNLARARDLAHTLGRARALAANHARRCPCGGDLTRDLAHARKHARGADLARTLDRARDLARVLDRDLGRDLAHDVALDLPRVDARRLVRAVEAASDGAHQLVVLVSEADADADVAATADEKAAEHAVCTSSRRLVRWSVRVLPTGKRGRYEQEFHAELFELRAEPRRRQLAYAVRVSVRAVRLRRELCRSAPERAR